MPTYATWDTAFSVNYTPSGGDLTLTKVGTSWAESAARGTIPLDTGYGYVEITGVDVAAQAFIGLIPATTTLPGTSIPYTTPGTLPGTYGSYAADHAMRLEGVGLASGVFYALSETNSIRYDNHLFEVFRNGVLVFSTTVAAGEWHFYAGLFYDATNYVTVNAGQTAFNYPLLDTAETGWSEGGGGGGGGIMGNICSDICSNIG